MVRRGRSSLRSSTRNRRSSSPKVEEDDAIDDTPNQEQDNAQSPAISQSNQEAGDGDDEPQPPEADANDEDHDDEPPPQSSEHGEDASNPSTPRTLLVKRGRGRGRGRGRPSLRRMSVRSSPDGVAEDGSDATPRRGRGRGRGGGWRGGPRGRGRGAGRGASHVTRVPIDKEGTMAEVVDDEVSLPEDPEGETKVDKNGNLLGGREYRVRTFTIAGRGDKLYMLSTEPARCTGFRDSYLFFNKHLTLFKIIIDDEEKRDLIERELIPHSYKGRAIGVVTARSVFREFGCKIVVGGKKVTDDYQVTRARDRGDVEGELADPYDKIPEAGEIYNRNQYVAWHGASSVYHTQTPNAQAQGRPPFLNTKKRTTITSANWMHEHAMAASAFNSSLNVARKTTFNGVYDPHTNLLCYPSVTQPTHVKWERVPTPPTSPVAKKRKLAMLHGDYHDDDDNNYDEAKQTNGIQNESLTNGTAHESDDENELSLPPRKKRAGSAHSSNPIPPHSSLPAPSEYLKETYLIVDTHFISPPSALYSLPGINPDGSTTRSDSTSVDAHSKHIPATTSGTIPISAYTHHDISAGRPIHLGIPRLSESEMEDVDLPEDCREAIRQARREEVEWTSGWANSEAVDGGRGPLRLGVGI